MKRNNKNKSGFLQIFSLFFLLLIFENGFLSAKTDINSKINSSKQQLKKIDSELEKYNSRLASIGKEIFKYRSEVNNLDKELYQIEKELNKQELSYNNAVKRLKELKKTEKTLIKNQKIIEKKIIKAIAKIVSISFVTTSSSSISHNTQEGIITEEFLLALQKQKKVEMKKLDLELKDSREKMFALNKNINELKVIISDVQTKRETILKKKREKSALIHKSQSKQREYKSQLDESISQQNNLKKVIADLKSEQEKLLIAQSQKKAGETKVKNYASNYKEAKTSKWRGEKTISPLEEYTVTKKYGPYVDPIYNIKIFNESVNLKSGKYGANVFNVFNGKVSLIKKHVLLNNIVVVEHFNGLQTVYAYLEKIAPGLTVGKRIKKGAVIGRINSDLMFEVMNKNNHINPLDIIQKSK